MSQPVHTWRLTGLVLVEESPEVTRLWGRWDTCFGCWRQTAEGLREDRPAARLLDRRGVWLDPPGARDESWYQGRAAIAAYFSLIPTAIRRLAAQSGDQWATLETLWHDPLGASRFDIA